MKKLGIMICRDASHINLEAACGCGGKMIPHPKRPLEWICDRQRWWKPWEKHAHLKAHVSVHQGSG